MPPIKKLIPPALKRLPWYILKSPQRRLGLWQSWAVELKGALIWLKHKAVRKPLRPISVCCGIKNRTDNFLEYVLPSLLALEHRGLVELSVFDCGSDDVVRLEAEIRKKWLGRLVFHTDDTSFSRSFAFNRAIRQSTAPLVFACDADMSLPADLVQQVNHFVSAGTVWFPVCFNLAEGRPAQIASENGTWWQVGKGMFAARRHQFEKAGGYNEEYKTWGHEDWDLWFRFWQTGLLPLRSRCRGLFHHYHPSLKPADFQPKF